MKIKRYISHYQHTDGTKWVGPDYYAVSLEEAQMLAMEYPIQPITVIGEYRDSDLLTNGDVETSYFRGADGKIH